MIVLSFLSFFFRSACLSLSSSSSSSSSQSHRLQRPQNPLSRAHSGLPSTRGGAPRLPQAARNKQRGHEVGKTGRESQVNVEVVVLYPEKKTPLPPFRKVFSLSSLSLPLPRRRRAEERPGHVAGVAGCVSGAAAAAGSSFSAELLRRKSDDIEGKKIQRESTLDAAAEGRSQASSKKKEESEFFVLFV